MTYFLNRIFDRKGPYLETISRSFQVKIENKRYCLIGCVYIAPILLQTSILKQVGTTFFSLAKFIYSFFFF